MKDLFFYDRFVHEVITFEILQVFCDIFVLYLLMADQVQTRVTDCFVEKGPYGYQIVEIVSGIPVFQKNIMYHVFAFFF